MSDVITRFAPSPTGHLHIGGARTALFCWAFAKRAGGRFMLRIEDTDQARSSDESAVGIMEDLAWLGIEWDDGPKLKLANGRTVGESARTIEGGYFQARRVSIYNRYFMQLVEQGKAYPAFESEEELAVIRKAAIAAKQTYRYDRASWNAIPTPAARLARIAEADAKGEKYILRLFAPHEEIVVHDQVLGDVRYAAGEMDDFVIRKADGFPTYHFAVVVDDETMGVTHVLRAQEHLNNTPRHVALQRALGFRTPIYAHMPLITNMDGSKMSKRDKAKSARLGLQQRLQKDTTITAETIAPRLGIEPAKLDAFLAKDNDAVEIAEKIAGYLGVPLPEIEVSDFRAAGYVPEAINNFIALLGWNPGMKLPDGKDLEKFDTQFLASHFAVDRIGKTSAKFDRNKLLSFNGDAIAAMDPGAFASRWLAWLNEFGPPGFAKRIADDLRDAAPRFEWLITTVRPRAKTFKDALKACEFMLRSDDSTAFDKSAVDKNLLAVEGSGLAILTEFRAKIALVEPFEPAPLHAAIDEFSKARNVGMGAVAQPVRVALTGSTVSPPLGETMAIIGKASTLARIDRCIQTLR